MRNSMTFLRRLQSLLAVVGLLALFAACGTPTPESQVARYKSAMDRLDLIATKYPQARLDIDRKKLEFNAEFETVKTLTGDDGSKKIGALCRRVESFESGLASQYPMGTPGAPGGMVQPGSKLGAVPGQPGVVPLQPGVQPGVQPGGKLGGAPGAAPGVVPAGDSGFGGGAAPAPGTVPAPQGGSGFGGGAAPAPAPGVVPAPAPAPQGGSGFGGQ